MNILNLSVDIISNPEEELIIATMKQSAIPPVNNPVKRVHWTQLGA